jgi:hypothetical protein
VRRDFDITAGIYLSQASYELDLHNHFDFVSVDYSVETRIVALHWRRAKGDGVPAGAPKLLTVSFREVSEFRFVPRDTELPFSEGDCMNAFGYWADENWAAGVILIEGDKEPDPKWLTAVEFMSGAVILVRASFANAVIAA